MGRAFARNGALVSTVMVIVLAVALTWASATLGGQLWVTHGDGNFYTLIPHSAMAGLFGAVGGAVLLALVIRGARYWRASGERPLAFAGATAWRETIADALTLKYLR